jgi:transcriptional regulator with XRE-family HTH domain
MTSKRTALSENMPSRVRNRREAKRVSGADLARRVGVSPAYVSQIEKGIRVPDVPVAIRIASALDDDEALYVAWCRDHKANSRSKTPSTGDDDAWTRLYRSDRFEDDVQFGQAVRSGEDIPSPRGRSVGVVGLRNEAVPAMSTPLFDSAEEPAGSVEQLVESLSVSARREGRALVTAPVLEPGKDPGERDEVPKQLWIDTMVIDPRSLPDVRLGRPFVFRADEEVSRRVRDRVAPGDLVIVSRDLDDEAPVPGRVYAMRKGGRVFLGRLTSYGEKLLVQPGPGESEMVDLGLGLGKPAKPAVVGELVAVIKGRGSQ